MIINPMLPYIPPYRPLSNITPFTYRDGLTYADELENLKTWLNNVVEFVNENFTELGDKFGVEVGKLIDSVNAIITTQTDLVNQSIASNEASVDAKISDITTFVNGIVQSIIDDSIQVQDPVVAGILEDPNSESSAVLSATIGAQVAALSEQGPGTLAVEHGVVSVPLGSADMGTYTPDMAPAINALIAAVSDAGGGKIILPAGEIRHDTPINPKSNVLLVGSGIGGTVLLPLQYGFLHTSADPDNVLYNFHQRDMTVNGRRVGIPVGTWKGWHGQYHELCSWVDVEYKNFGMTGLGPDYLRDCVIDRVWTRNTGTGNDGTMPSGNGIGVAVGGTWNDGVTEENFTITNCHVHNAKRHGIMWEGGVWNVAGQAYGGAVVTGNTATGCGDSGINCSGGRNSVIANNYTYNNVKDGIWVGIGTLPNSAPGWRTLVTGNQSHGNGRHGIGYDEVAHAKLGDTVKIFNNVVTSNGEDGINVTTGGSDLAGVDVSANLCHSNTLAGIRVKSGKVIGALKVDDNLLVSNYAVAGGATPSQIAQLMFEGVTLRGGSVSDNVFHGSAAQQRQCIMFGSSTSPATLTRVKVHGNVPPGTGTNVTVQAANATMTECDVRGNLGYFLGNPEAVTVGASPYTYTAGPTPETMYVRGGTVTAIRKGGVAVFVATEQSVPLEPNQSAVIEYTTLPIVYRERRQ